MIENFNLVTELKNVAKTTLMVGLPLILENYSPGLGTGLTVALQYLSTSEQRNLMDFLEQLELRLQHVELKTESFQEMFKSESQLVIEAMNGAIHEKVQEKIAFYVGAASEALLIGSESMYDQDLKVEYIRIISELSGFELKLLQALEKRPRGESLSIPFRGKFLHPDIEINDKTRAWIDILIRKGLIIDTSIEKINAGFESSSRKILERSAIRLSNLARSMINYMLDVQKTDLRLKD